MPVLGALAEISKQECSWRINIIYEFSFYSTHVDISAFLTNWEKPITRREVPMKNWNFVGGFSSDCTFI